MSRIISIFFYFTLLVMILLKLPYVFARDYATADFKSFAWFLNYTNSPEPFILALSVLALAAIAWCMVRPGFAARVVVAFLYTTVCLIPYSFGKISHSGHAWMLAAFAMIFFKSTEPISGRNSKLIQLVQTIILATYFTSALWKVRSWVSEGNFDFRGAFLDNIAYSIAEGSGPTGALLNILEHYAWIFSAGFAVAFLFQFSSIIPIFFTRLRIYWGWAAFTFHMMTGLVLGIWFNEHNAAMVFFLILIPTLQNQLKDQL